jgi:hypothetical protein
MNRWSLFGDGFAGLARWIRRRPISPDEFTYHRQSQLIGFLAVLLFTLPVEILLVELLIPWDVVRWILLAVAVIGSLWAIGVIVSVRTFPHRLLESVVEVRYGALGGALVPHDRISLAWRCRAASHPGARACSVIRGRRRRGSRQGATRR